MINAHHKRSRKTFIVIKRGLSATQSIVKEWATESGLFMHIIDKVDWETGIVYDWKDKG